MSNLQLFRVTWFTTKSDNKYSEEVREFISDRESAWDLWYVLHRELGYPHVEVARLDGGIVRPERGMGAM
jgi:hypothetical protein